jgi:urease accessory protein
MRSFNVRTIDGPFGNIDDFAIGSRRVERVVIPSDDLAKRVLRLATSAGEVGICFGDERRLRDGDVVYADETLVIAIEVEADEVLVAQPKGIAEAIDLAHALGNRHIPIQREGDALIVRDEPALEALFAQLGVEYRREARRLARPFRHAAAPHAHE